MDFNFYNKILFHDLVYIGVIKEIIKTIQTYITNKFHFDK